MDTVRILLRLVAIQVRSQMVYRASFAFDILSNFFLNGVFFVSFALVIQRFGNVAGWSLGEIAFLWGLAETSFGLQEVIFSGFDDGEFSQMVRLGQFDQLLLRPIDITAQVMGSRPLAMRRLGRVLEGAAILVFSLLHLTFHWTWVKLLLLPVAMLSMIAFFGGLFIIGAALTIWTIQPVEAINIFTYGGTEMMSYPMSIYPERMHQFFTYFIPAIFLNYYPTLYILDKPDPFHLPSFAPFLAPLAGTSVLVASLLFWKFGIKHYQSTGT